MNNKIKKVFFTIASSAILLSSCFGFRITEAKATTDVIQVDVSAAKSNFRRAVQNALNEAATQATDAHAITVRVPEGTYTQDAYLYIQSNTTLDLTGVTIVRSAATNCIRVGVSDDKNSGVTGYAYHNIRIVGGTIDGAGKEQTIVKATHCSDFYMTGVSLKNTRNGHMMEAGGVDGLYINKCSFTDQEITASNKAKAYEAIQIDILSGEHMSGTRSEVLATKNVQISNCSFKDVPRGVGSHTAISNVPVDTISISKCTFDNTKSCAIQSLNWVNVSIQDNEITNAPRGIAVYYAKDNGQGTYLPSAIAEEGNTTTEVEDKYIPNDKQNIRISRNRITLSDTKDPYSNIVKGAIVAAGCAIDGKHNPSDGSGRLPKGNYYISQVTIDNNKIVTFGNGIRITDGKNCAISNNTITCKKSTHPDNGGADSKNYYGIQARDHCEKITIKKNKVSDSVSNGIYVSEKSKAGSIENNTITNAGKYGIDIEDSTTDAITNNTIKSVKVNGIYVYNKASVKKISKNNISNAKKYGIDVESSKVLTIEKNKVLNTGNNGIFIFNKSECSKILENQITKTGNQGISVNTKSTAGKISGNSIRQCKAYGIAFGSKAKGTEIQKNKISGCKSGKIGIAKDSSVKTVK